MKPFRDHMEQEPGVNDGESTASARGHGGSPHGRGQCGAMLVEVVLALTIAGLVIGGFLGWGLLSLSQQESARATNEDTFGLGMASVRMPHDVASSVTGVTKLDETGTPRSSGDIRDCTGGDGAGGEVLTAMITSAQRRITYTLVDSTENPGTQDLWRRECPNLSGAGDATLNDTSLNAPGTVNPGAIDPGTSGNDGTSERMSVGVLSAESSCPREGGSGEDPNCRTILVVADVEDRPNDAVLKGTRRINAYAPPGTAPIPSFTFSPNPPQRNETVTFDATGSTDPVGGTLTYSWDFGDGTTSNAGPVVTHSFSSLSTYTVSLSVTNSAGTPSQSPAIRTVTVEPRRPEAAFLGVPLQAVRNLSKNFALTMTAYEGTLDTYSIDWGDGTSTDGIGSCAGTAAGNSCNPSESHTYSATGTYFVTLVVNDSAGNSKTVLASVTVTSGVMYVSASAGSDVSGCGSSGSPCKEIEFGLNEAQANSKSLVLVAGGNYGRFDVRPGVSVEGGYSSDFQARTETSTVTASLFGGQYSAIRADNVNVATEISGFEVVGPTLSAGSSYSAQAVVVRNGTSGLTLTELDVDGGQGPHASGVVVEGGSTATINDSDISSGTPLGTTSGRGNSAYGVRVVGVSNVQISGGSIDAESGVDAASNNGSTPATPPAGDGGNNGGNASCPSCPGGGGSGFGSGTQRGGNGGRGGQYSGGGGSGQSGGGGAGGGGGGCGSIFGCGGNAGGGGGGWRGAAGGAGSGGSSLAAPGDLWYPTSGGPGSNGGVGHGGGGGGGGKSASASGGGGGGGGEGGAGGTGQSVVGYSAGGSFGVYANDSTAALNGVVVTAAEGGSGSSGSPGGRGSNGGRGGNGGTRSCCSAGGGGGGGGAGGGGGGGGSGGGAGGPSISIYHRGTGSLTVSGGSRFRASSAAAGGTGGAGGQAGGGGAAGSGTQGGGSGGGGWGGFSGNAGQSGQSGLLARIWDNGSVTP